MFSTQPLTHNAGSVVYATHGGLQQVALGNGVIESTVYNARLQPTSIQAGSLMTLQYSYYASNNGNVATHTVTTGGKSYLQAFGYDLANRLTSASETTNGTGTWSEGYGYDQYGNRWVSTMSPSGLEGASTPTVGSNFDANNRLLVNGAAYDLATGNQTAIGGYTATYDSEQRLKSSTLNSNTTNYGYDADGRRVTKTGPAGTTVYVYDVGGALAAEYSTVPNTTASTLYLTADAIGSTRLVSNSAGAIVSCHDYLPFGAEILQSLGTRPSCYSAVDGVMQRFTGKERDGESSLDYFGTRYLSAAQGRFTSPDKLLIGQNENDPQSWNLYTYVRNNPLRYRDPDGLDYHVCVDGVNCFDLNDAQYQHLFDQQNGKQGIKLPLGVPGGNITCGGSVCGSATYFERGIEDETVGIGLGLTVGNKIGEAVLGRVFGWLGGIVRRGGATATAKTITDVLSGKTLTGFSEAQSVMVRRALTALEAARHNTGRIKELILVTDRPPTYLGGALSNMQGGADTITLAPGAFSSQQLLTHTIEEEVVHLGQNVQKIGVGDAIKLEGAVDAARKFPEPPR